MARRFFDHTGDIGVALTADSLPDLLREAARAFTATLVGDDTAVRTGATQRVSVGAATPDDLMIDWLGEVLYAFEVRNLLTADADIRVEQTVDGWLLEGELIGEPFDAARHPVQVLIKGITYHRLHVRQTPDGWQTDVVFDI